MIKPYVNELKDAVKDNEFFRKVVFTGSHLQLVLMSLEPAEEIGDEVHQVDQLLSIVKGEGKVVLDGDERKFEKGMVVCVPAGVRHNVINSGDKPLKVFTVYAPPQHAAGTVEETKPNRETPHFAEPVAAC